jgi:hypothetical protein
MLIPAFKGIWRFFLAARQGYWLGGQRELQAIAGGKFQEAARAISREVIRRKPLHNDNLYEQELSISLRHGRPACLERESRSMPERCSLNAGSATPKANARTKVALSFEWLDKGEKG